MNQSQRDKQAARQIRSRKDLIGFFYALHDALEKDFPYSAEQIGGMSDAMLKKHVWQLSDSLARTDAGALSGALVRAMENAPAAYRQLSRMNGGKLASGSYVINGFKNGGKDHTIETVSSWAAVKRAVARMHREGQDGFVVHPDGGKSYFHEIRSSKIPTPHYGSKEASGVPIAEVEKFVKRLRTYMEPDGNSSQGMNLTTRENGDVGDEQPGRADFAEAQRVGRAVLKEFGEDAVSVDVDHIDEWVTLSISLNHSIRKATSAARVALRFAARNAPPSITGSAALLKKQGLTPVDVFFGEARPHRRPIVGLNDMVQDRRGDLMYFAGIASDGTAILGKTEQEAKLLNKQVIEDRKHHTTRAASTNTQRDFYKASDGKWYVDNENYEEDEDGEQIEGGITSYGPFSSFEAAEKYMDRNFANSGGQTEDDSGQDRPPRKPVSPRSRRWAFSGPTAEGDFYDNPEKKEVLEFAQTGAISNSPEVAAAASEEDHLDIPKAVAVAEAEEAPPTPTEIKEEPGGKTLSTLNRLVVDSVDPDAAKAVETNKSRMAAVWFGAGLLRDYTTILGSKDKIASDYYQVAIEKWNEGFRKFEPASNKDSVSEALSHFNVRHSLRDIEAVSKFYGVWLVPLGVHSKELIDFGGLELGRRGSPYRLIAEMP